MTATRSRACGPRRSADIAAPSRHNHSLRFWEIFAAGGLVVGGLVAVVDNAVVHWVLDWHRLVPGRHAAVAELMLLVAGFVMLAGGWLLARHAAREPD